MKIKKIAKIENKFVFEAPLFTASIPSGVVPSFDNIEPIDLNTLLAPNLNSTFLVKVCGKSMIDEGIYDGDILIIDKSIAPQEGRIVIAALNGELTVKTFRIVDGVPSLISANKEFLPIKIEPYYEFEIQGVVKHVIHNV